MKSTQKEVVVRLSHEEALMLEKTLWSICSEVIDNQRQLVDCPMTLVWHKVTDALQTNE